MHLHPMVKHAPSTGSVDEVDEEEEDEVNQKLLLSNH